jgi:hypothetical protein
LKAKKNFSFYLGMDSEGEPSIRSTARIDGDVSFPTFVYPYFIIFLEGCDIATEMQQVV